MVKWLVAIRDRFVEWWRRYFPAPNQIEVVTVEGCNEALVDFYRDLSRRLADENLPPDVTNDEDFVFIQAAPQWLLNELRLTSGSIDDGKIVGRYLQRACPYYVEPGSLVSITLSARQMKRLAKPEDVWTDLDTMLYHSEPRE